jgi:hypothetical protein
MVEDFDRPAARVRSAVDNLMEQSGDDPEVESAMRALFPPNDKDYAAKTEIAPNMILSIALADTIDNMIREMIPKGSMSVLGNYLANLKKSLISTDGHGRDQMIEYLTGKVQMREEQGRF